MGVTADEVEVWGDAPEPDAAGARVTSVDPRTLPASADLATAAARAPGVVVRRLGGLGDPAQIGVRGAGARHTEIWFDGIPLNPEGGEALDVSDLPLPAFERVDVIRGPSPTGMGTPALGGALWLTSRRDVVEGATLSVGSFGAGRATVLEGGRGGLLAVDGLVTGGGFRWYDDRGTPSTPGDDRVVRRENNDARRLSTLARADLGPATLLHAATIREDGVPGFTSEPTREAAYSLHRHLLGVTARGERGSTVATAMAFGTWRDETFSDPLGEVGLGAGSDRTRTVSAGLAPGVRVALPNDLRAELQLHGRVDRADDRGRVVGRAQLGLPWTPSTTSIWPTFQVVATSDGAPLWLPRLGVRRELGTVVLSATGGASGRPPDLIELYGDRGAQRGNPDLRPERGWGGDLGVSVGDRARAELVGFVTAARDLIVWIPTPQGVAVAQNVERARVAGLEASAGLHRDGGDLTVAGTWMDARRLDDDPAYDGRVLPRVPWGELVTAGVARVGRAELGADVSATSRTWTDAANLAPEAPRLLLGATTRADLGAGFRAELDVRNVLGTLALPVDRDPLVDDGVRTLRAMQDFGGYPLPGRSVSLSLSWAR